jgi:DNA-binding CsgD family transcriptional regulator
MSPQMEELSPGELKVLRYLPTNLSRPEIASELSVSANTVNTVNTHIRTIYAKLRSVTVPRPWSVRGSFDCCRPGQGGSAAGHLIQVMRDHLAGRDHGALR